VGSWWRGVGNGTGCFREMGGSGGGEVLFPQFFFSLGVVWCVMGRVWMDAAIVLCIASMMV